MTDTLCLTRLAISQEGSSAFSHANDVTSVKVSDVVVRLSYTMTKHPFPLLT